MDRLPVIKTEVDSLPSGLAAIVAAADLQAREDSPVRTFCYAARTLQILLCESLRLSAFASKVLTSTDEY